MHSVHVVAPLMTPQISFYIVAAALGANFYVIVRYVVCELVIPYSASVAHHTSVSATQKSSRFVAAFMASFSLPAGWQRADGAPIKFTNAELDMMTYDLYVITADENYFYRCADGGYVQTFAIPLGDGRGVKCLKVYADGRPLPGQTAKLDLERSMAVKAPAPPPGKRPPVVINLGQASSAAATPALPSGPRKLDSSKPPRIPAPWYEKARDGDYVVFMNREDNARCSELWGVETWVQAGKQAKTYWCFKKGERYDAEPEGADGRRIILVDLAPVYSAIPTATSASSAGAGAAKGGPTGGGSLLSGIRKPGSTAAAAAQPASTGGSLLSNIRKPGGGVGGTGTAQASSSYGTATAAAVAPSSPTTAAAVTTHLRPAGPKPSREASEPVSAPPSQPPSQRPSPTPVQQQQQEEQQQEQEEATLALPKGWMTAEDGEGGTFFWHAASESSLWKAWLAYKDPEHGMRFFDCVTWEESAGGQPAIEEGDESAAILNPDGSRYVADRATPSASPAAEATEAAEAGAGGVELPPGWAAVTDEETGETFYWKEETGETTWEVPTE